ncbi:hypothetical protein [Tardiphaga sp.]|uniref:hypothetical protein n=1 Tax=Tardiphaga sp. TaxID=1926292 RepID=UPI002613735B|nr:hypothetical protein [Tardiphaga sp.]MDB5618315.1 hypothetical protein [Tardiphaga sp.]
MQVFRTLEDVTAEPAFAASTTPTTALFTELLATACEGGEPMHQVVAVTRLKVLIAARAWNDAALALVALQLPNWRVRRLVYDDGEWYCALSSRSAMPEWLDTPTEAHHPCMALAIVSALLAATADLAPSHLTSAPASPLGDAEFQPVLCDNFA